MASSSFHDQCNYDVFLSFRGGDTHHNFISHLNIALCRKNIRILPFKDNELERGEEISPALTKAIEDSKISVIIFSKNYASSKWCWDELAKIIECKNTSGQTVVAVFYGVEPSGVRKQSGSFKVAFAKHEEDFENNMEKVQRWRAAMMEAASLSGWVSEFTKPESALVDEIVTFVLEKLKHMSLSKFKDLRLVGLDSWIERFNSFLCPRSLDVLMLGMWGMGGIGKTTIVETFFNRYSSQFEACFFIPNIRERSEKLGLDHLRKELLFKILEDKNLRKGTPLIGSTFIKDWLNRKKLLIVFDDVTTLSQLETLVGGPNIRVGSLGSRIIITSRDIQVLKNCEVDYIQEVQGLKKGEALQLFCQYAFKQSHPTKYQLELLEKVVSYAKGNPLALKDLGSSLFNKSDREWKSKLGALEGTVDKEIEQVLKISYDEQVLQDLGRHIVREESITEPTSTFGLLKNPENLSSSGCKWQPSLPGNENAQRLHEAAFNGNWNAVEDLLETNAPHELLNMRLTDEGETALHIATCENKKNFVEKLVEKLVKFFFFTPQLIRDNLALQTTSGYTALCIAAMLGFMDIAKIMVGTNHISRSDLQKSLLEAVQCGCKEMAMYLFQYIENIQLEEGYRISLFVATVMREMYGICGEAFKPTAYQLLKKIWDQVLKLEDVEISILKQVTRSALFEAVKSGNVEFVSLLFESFRNLIQEEDEYCEPLFHAAILCRQEKIFNLIYEVGAFKDYVTTLIDADGNNMLHLAGKLSSEEKLDTSRPNLQMQQELFWFKEVEKIMPPRFINERNRLNETPKDVFLKEHEELIMKSRTAIKETASSCMVVSMLISTIVFAAAFTVPGFSNSTVQTLIFPRDTWFMIFWVSNTVALLSSCTSIIMLLWILTSRFVGSEYITSLRANMMCGFTALFVSISSMAIAFTAAVFMIDQNFDV